MSREAVNELEKASGAAHRACSPRLALPSLCRAALLGTGLLVWAIFCATFDNVVRPMLIKRGADLPLLLIFAGVIGGLIAFGVIGLFIGPVVLAVAYTLLIDWMSENEGPPQNRPAGP